MTRLRLTGPARRDIANALRHSEDEFGASARTKYRDLLDRALRDLAEDPTRPGTRDIADVRAGYFVYHLRWSNPRRSRSVGQPRHLFAFFIDANGDVVIARLLHERQLLEHHLQR